MPTKWDRTYFYSRPCGRGDTNTKDKGDSSSIFLLTPLREGRRSLRIASLGKRYNFYSRPCGRGDGGLVAGFAVDAGISTHAPAGGATLADHNNLVGCETISTHAPAGGATRSSESGAREPARFLLTPLREGRPPSLTSPSTVMLFLLTPLREGRRTLSCVRSTPSRKFLLTPLREGRQIADAELAKRVKFLLTPLREGRPSD